MINIWQKNYLKPVLGPKKMRRGGVGGGAIEKLYNPRGNGSFLSVAFDMGPMDYSLRRCIYFKVQ